MHHQTIALIPGPFPRGPLPYRLSQPNRTMTQILKGWPAAMGRRLVRLGARWILRLSSTFVGLSMVHLAALGAYSHGARSCTWGIAAGTIKRSWRRSVRITGEPGVRIANLRFEGLAWDSANGRRIQRCASANLRTNFGCPTIPCAIAPPTCKSGASVTRSATRPRQRSVKRYRFHGPLSTTTCMGSARDQDRCTIAKGIGP
jgi:hypothetical protein